MEKFKIFYANGCSHTAGGGLDGGTIRKNNTDEFIYEKLYGIKRWNHEKEVTYPRRVADHLGLKWINDAASGSGAHRLVRTTNEYIRKVGLEKLKKHIIFLQINNPINRIEMYSSKIDDYVIVNPEWNEKFHIESLSVVDNYSINTRKYHPNFFKDKIENEVKLILENYFDPIKYQVEIYNNLINLFSFLELNKIEYFYCLSDELNKDEKFVDFFNQDFVKNRNIIIDGCIDISHYAEKHKLTCNDETNGINGDFHAGYFGNLKYGELLAEEIKKKLNL